MWLWSKCILSEPWEICTRNLRAGNGLHRAVKGIIKIPVCLENKLFLCEFRVLENSEIYCLLVLDFLQRYKCSPMFSRRELKKDSTHSVPSTTNNLHSITMRCFESLLPRPFKCQQAMQNSYSSHANLEENVFHLNAVFEPLKQFQGKAPFPKNKETRKNDYQAMIESISSIRHRTQVPPTVHRPSSRVRECLLVLWMGLGSMRCYCSLHRCLTRSKLVKIPNGRKPFHYKDDLQWKIDVLLDKNLISRCYSFHSSPALLVPKLNGKLHLVNDYPQLN